jgi:hypothetical protein
MPALFVPVANYIALAWIAMGATYASVTAIASAMFYGTVILGSVGLTNIQRQRMEKKAASAMAALKQPVTVRSPVMAAQYLYGCRRIGGVLVFAGVSGSKNEYLNMVIALTAHKAGPVEAVYFNEEEVPIDYLGRPTSGKYVGKAQVMFHDGDSAQIADAGLVSAMPGQWSSDHKLSGVSYVYVWLKYDQDAFSGGAIPNITLKIKGRQDVYDPRDSSTAYLKNVALCIRHYLLSSEGLGATSAEIDEDSFTAAANACDETVAKAEGGYEKRYELDYTYSAEAAPEEVLRDMVQSCAGRLIYSGGKFSLYVGYQTPAVSFSEADLVAGVSMSTRVSARDRANAVRGSFASDATNWQPDNWPSYKSSAYLTADGGSSFEKWIDLDLPGTTSASTCQRIGKIELERMRREISCRITTNLKGLQVRCGDTIRLSFSAYGWINKTFEVVEWKFSPQQQGESVALVVEMSLRETDANVFAWTSAEETPLPAAVTTNLPDARDVAAPTSVSCVSATDGLQPDGAVVPALQLSWVPPSSQFVQSGGRYDIQYKKSTSSDWLDLQTGADTSALAYITGLKIGVTYNTRIRAVNAIGATSAWVEASAVEVGGDTTAPAAPTGLTATAGTGKAISLDWADNTESDLSEYEVARSIFPFIFNASVIASTRASRFVDADVNIGWQYYYWIRAIDRSENVSDWSAYAEATVSAVTDAEASDEVPTTPSAPSYSSEGAYVSGDGTVFSFVVLSVASLPTGARYQNILYRKNGSSDAWVIASQESNTSTATVRIDDLTPSITYEFAVKAYSFAGTPSAVSSTITRTAPNKTTNTDTPASLTYTAGDSASYGEKPSYSSFGLMYSCKVQWDAAASKDFAKFQYVTTTTDTDAAADTAANPVGPGLYPSFTTEPKAIISTDSVGGILTNLYFRVRSINNSGIASAWSGGGTNLVTSLLKRPAGDMSEQNKNAVKTSGIQTGDTGASSVRKVICRYVGETNFTPSGTSPTEGFYVSLTNRGFTTKADYGVCVVTNDTSISATYLLQDSGSTSTQATVELRKLDGSNLPNSSRTIMFEFVEFD